MILNRVYTRGTFVYDIVHHIIQSHDKRIGARIGLIEGTCTCSTVDIALVTLSNQGLQQSNLIQLWLKIAVSV